MDCRLCWCSLELPSRLDWRQPLQIRLQTTTASLWLTYSSVGRSASSLCIYIMSHNTQEWTDCSAEHNVLLYSIKFSHSSTDCNTHSQHAQIQ